MNIWPHLKDPGPPLIELRQQQHFSPYSAPAGIKSIQHRGDDRALVTAAKVWEFSDSAENAIATSRPVRPEGRYYMIRIDGRWYIDVLPVFKEEE